MLYVELLFLDSFGFIWDYVFIEIYNGTINIFVNVNIAKIIPYLNIIDNIVIIFRCIFLGYLYDYINDDII